MELEVYKARTSAGAWLVWAANVTLSGSTLYFHNVIGISAVFLVGVVFLVFMITRGRAPETRRLRTVPLRGSPANFPRAVKNAQTVTGRLRQVGPSLRCPCPVEGPVVAWSLDRNEDFECWYTVSCGATLHVESRDGLRFDVELTQPWQAITASQTRIPRPSTDEEIESARRAWAEALEDARPVDAMDSDSGRFERAPADFAEYLGADVVQSVILAEREVAITGVFEAIPNGYPRGETLPTFVLRSGTVDDFTLDREWKRAVRQHQYVAPVIAFVVAAGSFWLAFAVA